MLPSTAAVSPLDSNGVPLQEILSAVRFSSGLAKVLSKLSDEVQCSLAKYF